MKSDNSHIDLVVEMTARYHRIRPEDLLGNCREHRFVQARHQAIYLARELTGLSAQKLGYAFNRDHSVILYCLRKLQERLPLDGQLAAILELLRDRIGKILELDHEGAEVVIA